MATVVLSLNRKSSGMPACGLRSGYFFIFFPHIKRSLFRPKARLSLKNKSESKITWLLVSCAC